MTDIEAINIIMQGLVAYGRDTFVGTDVEGYESPYSMEELARLIVRRLRENGNEIMKPKNAPIQLPHSGSTPHGISFRVPWRIHEKAWREYAKNHPGQSAERLAERGGFSLEELIYLLAGEDPWSVRESDDSMATNFFRQWPRRIEEDLK